MKDRYCSLTTERVKPNWTNSIPFHSDKCPSYGGKRCGELGYRPDNFCEPTIKVAVGKALDPESDKEAIDKEWLEEALLIMGKGIEKNKDRLDAIEAKMEREQPISEMKSESAAPSIEDQEFTAANKAMGREIIELGFPTLETLERMTKASEAKWAVLNASS